LLSIEILNKSHLDGLYEIVQDKEVMKWLGNGQTMTRQKTLDLCMQSELDQETPVKNRKYFSWVIKRNQS
jgi:hypothetical protein